MDRPERWTGRGNGWVLRPGCCFGATRSEEYCLSADLGISTLQTKDFMYAFFGGRLWNMREGKICALWLRFG